MAVKLIEGDCIEAMREMDEASVDSIVTDPPYGLEFMGKEWDRFDIPKRRQVNQPQTGDRREQPRYMEMPLVERRAFAEWCCEWATVNIDGCRVQGTKPHREVVNQQENEWDGDGPWKSSGVGSGESSEGRWPANVVLDGAAAAELDRQSGELHSQDPATRRSRSMAIGVTEMGTGESIEYADRGGASRFFYCAKASRAERNAGLDGFPSTKSADEGYGSIQEPKLDRATPRENWTPHRTANHHPTVKPIDLMRWLVRLVTPPSGTVLDPFTGSGTTGCAAVLEDFDFIGIEREAEYVEVARARIDHAARQPKQLELVA